MTILDMSRAKNTQLPSPSDTADIWYRAPESGDSFEAKHRRIAEGLTSLLQDRRAFFVIEWPPSGTGAVQEAALKSWEQAKAVNPSARRQGSPVDFAKATVENVIRNVEEAIRLLNAGRVSLEDVREGFSRMCADYEPVFRLPDATIGRIFSPAAREAVAKFLDDLA